MTIIVGATLHGYAQNAAENFLPRANDEVKRQQVAYVAANEGAENTVWDFTQLECSGREYPACYAEEEAYEGLIVGTEFNTRHYYQASTDSLLLRGYENNLTKVEYDRPELLLPLPLTYGERRETLFHGTAAHHRGTDTVFKTKLLSRKMTCINIYSVFRFECPHNPMPCCKVFNDLY